MRALFSPNTEENPMPKGPQGQKRPGNVVGAAIMVARIATGAMPAGMAFIISS
jgi:hypothetical protein